MAKAQSCGFPVLPSWAHVGNRLAVVPEQEAFHTKTRIDSLVREYIAHIFASKRFSGARVDAWYLQTMFGMRPKTGPRIDAEFLEEITATAVSRFLDALMRERKLSGKTVNRFRELLNRLINWAARERGIIMPGHVNPVAFVRPYKERRTAVRYLTLDDIKRQFDALENHPVIKAMAAMFIFAGLRRSELLWLTRADVDLKASRHGVVRIRAKKVSGQFWETKTGKDRSVPVNSALRSFLDVYEAIADPDRVWFFPSSRGGRWDPDNFAERLREINRAAGLSWSCLDFRHTFGSQLAMKGVSLYKISELMGNSPEVCRRHYAVLSMECLIDEVEFPSLLEPNK